MAFDRKKENHIQIFEVGTHPAAEAVGGGAEYVSQGGDCGGVDPAQVLRHSHHHLPFHLHNASSTENITIIWNTKNFWRIIKYCDLQVWLIHQCPHS